MTNKRENYLNKFYNAVSNNARHTREEYPMHTINMIAEESMPLTPATGTTEMKVCT
jgi:hypothetical protein